MAKLSDIIQETLEFCHERFKLHNIDLQVAAAEDYTVSCRAPQISQVLLNLLNNAFDAIVDRNEQKWVKVICFQKKDFFCIRLVDCGPGIPPDLVEKIMNPFFSTKSLGKGTGLGLSLSKGIMESHKGHLRYETFENHTSFVLEFPKRVTQAINSERDQL